MSRRLARPLFKVCIIATLCILSSAATIFMTEVKADEVQASDLQIETHNISNAGGTSTIQILAAEATDAIVLKSVNNDDGEVHIGIIDSAQGYLWPDGSDSRYPVRPGTSHGGDQTARVEQMIRQAAGSNAHYDFYIGTHAHSDHIGTSSVIIKEFKPKRIYTPYYDDALVSLPERLWDNQYQYDLLREAAAELGGATTFIRYLSADEPVDPREANVDSTETDTDLPGKPLEVYTANPEFTLGDDMMIKIINDKIKSPAEKRKVTYHDANDWSLGVLVTSKSSGATAYLGGDMNNMKYDTFPFSNNDEDTWRGEIKKYLNDKKYHHISFMKLNHHGNPDSNTYNFVRDLNPTVAFQTGPFSFLTDDSLSGFVESNTKLYEASESAASGALAINVELSRIINEATGEPYVTNQGYRGEVFRARSTGTHHLWCYEDGKPKTVNGWKTLNGVSTYFENAPYAVQDKWVPGSPYATSEGPLTSYAGDKRYINNAGVMEKDGWKWCGNAWYYFNSRGEYAINQWIVDDKGTYYVDGEGHYLVGMHVIDGKTYNFNASGYMITGWVQQGNQWLYFLPNGQMAVGTWNWINGKWYGFNWDGTMCTGWTYDSGYRNWFYCDPSSGAMYTNCWAWIGNAWYGFWADGQMCRDWIWDTSYKSWFYCDPSSGAMYTNCWAWIGNAWYGFWSNGTMCTGWVFDHGYNSWFYCDPVSGRVYEDCWASIGGKYYYFKRGGYMA